jgi:hypothetical protein
MKQFKKYSVIGFILLAFCLLGSCASTSSGGSSLYRPLTASEVDSFDFIGIVQITFTGNTSALDGRPTTANKEDAYISLLAEAKKNYQRNDIDIKNISVVNQRPGYWRDVSLAATGYVVVRSGSNTATSAGGVEDALARAANDTLKNTPSRSKIAIVYITAQDRSTTEYIAGEIEFIWVNAGFTIIDRSQLNRIRREQNFQMSGEVDDATAVSIGKFAGADIIVTGKVDGEGNLRRLRLRALDTQTAQVVGVASERL